MEHDDMMYDEEEDLDEQYIFGQSEDSEELSSSHGSNETKRDEIYALIASQPFSANRVNFLERSKHILELIDTLSTVDEGKGENDDEVSSTTQTDTSNKTSISFDPMALPMVKNQLERRKKRIRRGFDYAISAKVLLDAMRSAVVGMYDEESLRHLLFPMLLGTMNHGNLSLIHFWQILSRVLPEFSLATATTKMSDEPSLKEQSCQSPLSAMASSDCPPRAIQRNSVTIPPHGIVQLLDEWCNAQMGMTRMMNGNDSGGTCHAEDTEDPDNRIPTDVPDGFAGYFVVQPRDESDYFHSIFHDIELRDDDGSNMNIAEGLAALTELEEALSKLEHEQEDLEKSIAHLTDLLGGVDGSAFGPDGELYALKDTCHSIDTGKYTYEACLFGAASQKESGHGTDLGKWVSMAGGTAGAIVDVETGRRVWKWENGAKCWNGPQRSCTVLVTCGDENKIISAQEPETCKYVLEMESYIACDEAYQKRHGLSILSGSELNAGEEDQ
jgi:Glucosidase II beta subunit-like protein